MERIDEFGEFLFASSFSECSGMNVCFEKMIGVSLSKEITRVFRAVVLGVHMAVFLNEYTHNCPLCFSSGTHIFFTFDHLFFECPDIEEK
jgi:hypothetical protein